MLAMRVDILLVLISWRKHPITVVWHGFYVKIDIQSQALRTCYLFAVVSLGWRLFSPLRAWFFIRCHAVRTRVGILNLTDSLLNCGR